MKKLFYLTFTLLLPYFNCAAQTFEVDTVTFHTKGKIVSATWYDGVFYCMDEDRNLSKVDSTGTETFILSSRLWLESIFYKDGKLTAWSPLFSPRRYNMFIEYQYDGKKLRRTGLVRTDKTNLYEDQLYQISASCSGEWGGTVYFKHKKSRKTYSCEATCAIQVNKLADDYIVTATLGHMMGFVRILSISDPPALERSKKKSSKYSGGNESRSLQGVKVLADSMGVMALTSFVHQGQVYHVLNKGYDWQDDIPAVYIATTRNGKFEIIQQINNVLLWRSDNSREIPYKDGFLLAVTDDETREALMIGIEDGRMKVFRFEQQE